MTRCFDDYGPYAAPAAADPAWVHGPADTPPIDEAAREARLCEEIRSAAMAAARRAALSAVADVLRRCDKEDLGVARALAERLEAHWAEEVEPGLHDGITDALWASTS